MGANSYVGSLPDHFSVDSDGGTNYIVPIDMPPGTNRMLPKLSVGYNSGGGNGLLGVGWRLLGLSSITRTKATVAQDGFQGTVNFDANDRFALDGQRLMLASGSSYDSADAVFHTEIESWQKIVPQYATADTSNGPQSFLIYAPDGMVLEYGTGSGGAVPPSNDASKVKTWSLSRATDVNGNYLTISYEVDPADYDNYPSSIDYTANDAAGLRAQRSVKFAYQSRTDSFPQYQGGGMSATSRLLQQIQTLVDGNPVRTYAFSYAYGKATGRSLLQSITVSDNEGSSLPATTFSWQDSDAGTFGNTGTPVPTNQPWRGTYYAVDLNGDGLVDLLNVYEFNNNVQFTAFFSDGSSFSPAGGQTVPTTVPFYPLAQIIPLDVNGDGCMDLVYAYSANGNLALTLFTSVVNGEGWSMTQGTLGGGCPPNIPYGILHAMDVDGDGLSDLVCVHENSNVLALTPLFSNGSAFAPSSTDSTAPTKPFYSAAQVLPLDFNGNGMMDLLYAYHNGSAMEFVLYSSNGRAGFTEQPGSPLSSGTVQSAGVLLVSDFNGDGIDDLVQASLNNGQLALQTVISNGRSLVAGSPQNFNVGTVGTQIPILLPMEVNGDGLPDLVCVIRENNQLSLSVLLSNGAGFSQASGVNQPRNVQLGNQLPPLLPMDFNGDGKTDLVVVSQAGTLVVTPLPCADGFPDLMTSITNGLGGSYSIDYRPLTDATVYSETGSGPASSVEVRGVFSTAVSGASYAVSNTAPSQATTGASYTTRRVDFPKYVVAGYTKSDGYSGSYAYTQFYTGAMMDLTGRGWLGFDSITSSDASTGTENLVSYNQVFPLSHYVSATTLMKSAAGQSPALLLQQTSMAYASPENAPNTGTGIYQVRQTSVQTNYFTFAPLDATNPDCVFLKTFSNFDDFGNAQTIAHTGSALTSNLYVSKTFQSDPVKWRIGLEISTKATSDAAGTDLLSWKQAAYLPSGNVQSSLLWHDQTNRFLTTTYGYDAYGNRTSITSPNGNVTTIVFDSTYNTFIQSKSQVGENGKVLASTFAYSPQFGELLSHTDENNTMLSQALDGLGRMIGKTGPNPAGGTIQLMNRTWGKDGTGNYEQVTSLVDWTGRTTWTKQYLDGFSRTYRSSSLGPDGSTPLLVDCIYNSNDAVTQKSLPYFEGATAIFSKTLFDEYKRPISIEDPSPADDGATITDLITYQSTMKVLVTQAAGTPKALQTTYEYAYCNGKLLATRRTDAGNASTVYSYDGLGRLVSVVDPGGTTSTTTYDTVGRATSFTSTAGGTTLSRSVYTYDDIKGVETRKDEKGNEVLLQKDLLARLVTKTTTSVDIPGTETTTFAYDSPQSSLSLKRLSSVSMSNGCSYTFDYDAYGNQNSISLAMDGHNWSVLQTFGPTGDMVTRTCPDGSVESIVLNGGGETTAINFADSKNDPASTLVSFADFTSFGKPQTLEYGNGATEKISFGSLGQMKTQVLTGSDNTALFSELLQKDETGALVTSIDQLTNVQSQFDYDALGRFSGPTGTSYQYDASGNIELKDGVAYTSTGNRVTSGSQNGSTVYEAGFDDAGNVSSVTRNGATTKYMYDGENRLVEAGATTFAYDYTGRRVRKQVQGGPTIYSVAPYYQVAIFPDGSQQHTRFVCGKAGAMASITTVDSGNPPAYKGLAAPGIFYNHPDHLGSTVRQTDSKGSLAASIVYDAFGVISNIAGAITVPAMFTGKEWDDSTGLYYFGARYYDPVLGRFITADDQTGGPMGFRDVFNPYAYCLNDPVNNVDPLGHSISSFFHGIGDDLGKFGHDVEHLVHNRVFQLVTSYVVDGVLVLGGGTLLFLGFGTIGTTLMSAGLMGLVYDIEVSATGKGFSWKTWGEQLAIGAVTGVIAGGVATGAGIAADTIADAGTTSLNSAFEIGSGGRMALNIAAGAIGGGGGNVVGQVVSDAFSGSSLTSGLGFAALSGFIIGGAGTAIGEGTSRALSRVPTWDDASDPEMSEQMERTWRRNDDGSESLQFKRALDSSTSTKILVFLPGYLGNWASFGVSTTQGLHPSWFPKW
jgi:RHS repeat-associated protein